ncbi:MAG: dodecin domain-containing protein [Deltaproteobacteria bacterium]|nr:dodecin domain-containing protein [Deltaproteobacteria bacterium]
MADKAFTKLRLVGCSSTSIEAAVQAAISAAGEPVSWFEVVEVRGAVNQSQVHEWQVTVDLGVKLG